MQLLKRFQPLFLSFTVIACCLTFQADIISGTAHNAYASWISNGSAVTKTLDVYKIKPRKTESVLGNNFSIFSFKCFIKQHKSMFATNFKQQKTISLYQIAYYLDLTIQTSNTEDDSLIG
jgi:hypothetical protein